MPCKAQGFLRFQNRDFNNYLLTNACCNSSNKNAVTELAAELSLHPISSFAVRWRWRLQPGTPSGAARGQGLLDFR